MHTLKYLKTLISPNRCSTRKISRLSDRLVGLGTILRCMERAGRSCDAPLRTDMMLVVIGEIRRPRREVQQLFEVGHDCQIYQSAGTRCRTQLGETRPCSWDADRYITIMALMHIKR